MILGAILAGGHARRFGGDKALARWRGTSLIDHVAAALARHADRVVVCGRKHGELIALDDRPAADLGPLGGLNTALAYAVANGFDRVLTLPCDTPSIDRAILQTLVAQDSAAFIAACPVIGIWPSALGATLDRFLSEGEDRSMRAWARVAGARELALAAPENVNRRADLLRLEAGNVRY